MKPPRKQSYIMTAREIDSHHCRDSAMNAAAPHLDYKQLPVGNAFGPSHPLHSIRETEYLGYSGLKLWYLEWPDGYRSRVVFAASKLEPRPEVIKCLYETMVAAKRAGGLHG